MVSVRILIEGERVQGVGYRISLLERALGNGVENIYARNVDKNKVELLVSGDESKVKSFYEKIRKEVPKGARVKDVKEEPYDGKIPIPTIDRYFHFLTLEQLVRGRDEVVRLPRVVGAALEPIASALTGVNEKFDRVVERFGLFASHAKGMDEKLKAMDEKLDKIATLPEKLDTLPERIAEAIGAGAKKSETKANR